jgi:uncharacterized protein (DUF362 family)
MTTEQHPPPVCTVAAIRSAMPVYPTSPPFHPSESYPEYPFHGHISSEANHAYAAVRQLLCELGYDAANFGSPRWNPLGHLLKPGQSVVIKPNFVLSRHTQGKDLFSIITHASVLRAVADYCWIALQGRGRITIADAPQYDCNAEELPRLTGVTQVAEFLRRQGKVEAQFIDLRSYWSKGKHFDSLRIPLPGDPLGSTLVDLGDRSAMAGKSHVQQLYGAVYHREETIRHHSGGRHEYQVSRTMIEADLFISVPKLKVHKKVGVTLNAKGLVGMATNKNFLVHYTLCPPSAGGDQYPDGLFTPVEAFLIRTERWMYDHLLASKSPLLEALHRSIYWLHNHSTKLLGLKVAESKRNLDAGNWHGNDSAWRMAADLARILHFADVEGTLHSQSPRRMFTIIDGIIGGENNGPLTPDPKPSGVLIGSENLLAADLVATRLMGFDPLKLRLYRELLGNPLFDLGVRRLEDISVRSQEPSWRQCLANPTDRFLDFRPHPGWVGTMETKATH